MGTVSINSNLSAQAAMRRLGQVDARFGVALERLSTGMRINRASDDPAGLAVASTLDTQGRLYQQADRNIRDGLSVIEVLESALAGQSNILIRMTELAEQSANGSFSSKQREALQVEYRLLQQEFHRIAETTTFNGQKLARADHGGLKNLTLQAGITGALTSLLTTSLSDTGAYSGTLGLDQMIVETPENLNAFNDFAQSAPSRAQILERYGYSFSTQVNTGSGTREMILVFFTNPGSGGFQARGLIQQEGSDQYDEASFVDDKISIDALNFGIGPDGRISRDGNNWNVEVDAVGIATLNFSALRATNSPLSALELTGIENTVRARAALDATQARLQELSGLRGNLGATASRLNTSLALVGASRETNAAALSRLRDVDVAAESSQLATQQILRQAATAVLAQANRQPGLALMLIT